MKRKQLSRLVNDSILLRLDHFVVILILVVTILRCRDRGRGACWCVCMCVFLMVMISSRGSIPGRLILRGGVRMFFGLLTNHVDIF